MGELRENYGGLAAKTAVALALAVLRGFVNL